MQMAAPPRTKAKIGQDIELLLRWAYVDELSKRQSSAAEGIWDRIADYSNHGGIDKGYGAAQRYAHFGLPDPDAERIEQAVAALPDVVIDWDRYFDLIAGDLAGLISINDLSPRSQQAPMTPKAGWGQAGTKALKAWWGDKGAVPFTAMDRPRDVLQVAGIRARVLVTQHAVQGTRPDWRDQQPEPQMTPSARGTGAMVQGECRGKNLYTTGSCCPLTWSPSPLSIVLGRADYFGWHQGLMQLSETLVLDKFDVLPPKAPIAPWLDSGEGSSRIIPVVPNGYNGVEVYGTLPLKPARPKAGPPLVRRAGDVRRPLNREDIGW